MLGELGYTIAAQAARIEEALEATQNADFDHAILDANLNGQPASPVADALVARGTPFVFATGYGEVPEPYCDRPTLKKPFRSMGLSKCCRARWIAVASKLVSRGGYEGKGKGAQRSFEPPAPLAFYRATQFEFFRFCGVRRDRYHPTSGGA
jgi:CheY-like chemotaxis protein